MLPKEYSLLQQPGAEANFLEVYSMRVPLIATLDASNKETPFHDLDGVGRIPFSANDGDPVAVKADTVECRDFLSTGKSEINFWLEGVPAGSWDITVTDQRLVVYNRFSKGLIGKPKEKVETNNGIWLKRRS